MSSVDLTSSIATLKTFKLEPRNGNAYLQNNNTIEPPDNVIKNHRETETQKCFGLEVLDHSDSDKPCVQAHMQAVSSAQNMEDCKILPMGHNKSNVLVDNEYFTGQKYEQSIVKVEKSVLQKVTSEDTIQLQNQLKDTKSSGLSLGGTKAESTGTTDDLQRTKQSTLEDKGLIIHLERINPSILKNIQKYDESIEDSSALIENSQSETPIKCRLRKVKKDQKHDEYSEDYIKQFSEVTDDLISKDILKRKFKWRIAPSVVVLDPKNVDRRMIKNAIRRGAHFVDKSGVLKFKCPTCSFKTYSRLALSKHHSGRHGYPLPKDLKCPDCDYVTRARCTLKRHMEKHKKEPDLPCPHCPFKSRFECSLRIHLRRWHLSDEEAKTWMCNECQFSSVSSTAYKEHIRVHIVSDAARPQYVKNSLDSSSNDVIQCSYCRYKAPHKNALRIHLTRTHKIDKPFEKELYCCKICIFATQYRHSLRDHLITQHKSSEEQTQMFYCYNCDYNTAKRKDLVVHMRKHQDHHHQSKKEPEIFSCEFCDKQYTVKPSLTIHIKTKHTQLPPPLECQECGYTTQSKPSLRNHINNKHLNPKTPIYYCGTCDYVSRNKKKCKLHRLEHKVQCDICGFETSTKAILEYHIVGHMDKERQALMVIMFECPDCDYTSRNKSHFERHLDRWNHKYEGPLIAGWKD